MGRLWATTTDRASTLWHHLFPTDSIWKWLRNGLIVAVITANLNPAAYFNGRDAALGEAASDAIAVIAYPLPLFLAVADASTDVLTYACDGLNINCRFIGLDGGGVRIVPPRVEPTR